MNFSNRFRAPLSTTQPIHFRRLSTWVYTMGKLQGQLPPLESWIPISSAKNDIFLDFDFKDASGHIIPVSYHGNRSK